MSNAHTTGGHAPGEHNELSHVTSVKLLVGVWLALMVLTGVTVMATRVDLGSWNLPMAMVVATIKALLVCAFFMHLKFDKLFNTLVFFLCMVMVAYFLMMAILDSGQYQPDIERRAEAAAATAS